MRAIWKGAVAFGLVNVPVKLYAATGEHEVPLHQVHRTDGGRIRYRKTCSVCGESVEMADIAKGYETADGELVILTDEDMAQLPLATEREIEVVEFVPQDQVDPILLAKTYYLEPERTAVKPYALLREALATSERMAVVKVALRQRESMAVLRVRDDVICLQTLLWPDEVRAADFPILDTEVQVRPQELAMASSLVESLAADFDPSGFEDSYQGALESLIEAKVAAGSTQGIAERLEGAGGRESEGAEVVDLLAALQRSVEKARGQQAAGAPKQGGRTKRPSKASSAPPKADAEAGQRTGTDDAAPAPSARGRKASTQAKSQAKSQAKAQHEDEESSASGTTRRPRRRAS
ncbi:non-homologous end joining protein Ku [Cellulomonas timonensis]|uniref:non-homologous end joining protein Ku n=1 Tax=Cellulomonas timonensis TaxID=1689271 RepID=UPI0008364054|nr:Ku protein [Cellulomonas timonensis]